MKKALTLIIVSITSFTLGYFTATVKSGVEEKFAVMDSILIDKSNKEEIVARKETDEAQVRDLTKKTILYIDSMKAKMDSLESIK
jgi:hypothetical protein